MGKYCHTISGRRRYFEQYKAKEERISINTTVQGSAADFVKMATVKVMESVKKSPKFGLDPPKLVLQLHDELIFEVAANHVTEMERILREILPMPNVLDVTFAVKVKSGLSWCSLID